MLIRSTLLPLLAALPVSLGAPRTASSTAVSSSSRSPSSSGSASAAATPSGPPTRSHPTSQPHVAYSGTPSTTGALSASVIGKNVSVAPVEPAATTYPSDGQLHDPEPAPYVPAGGLGTNSTPVYNVKSDFDYESLALVLYQEWIELDLFQFGLQTFSASDFDAAGLTDADRTLIDFMAQQEVGHATLVSNILGASAPQQCVYNYPFTNVREFVDFCQKLTRFGESGVYGFLPHLNSREAAQLLLQSISTEARQQMIFRQFDGLFPMPVWFEVGVPQSWAWTLLAPYISYCPPNQTRLSWQNFPALWILNQPNPARTNASAGFNETLGAGTNTLNDSSVSGSNACFNNAGSSNDCSPSITQNRTIPLSYAGRQVNLTWDTPGKPVGPNNSYVTSTSAGSPAYVAWVSQLNVTYSALTLINSSFGSTVQPNVATFLGDPAVNGTMFIAITDDNPFLTPFNISLINPHVVAGPALYQAG